VHISSFSIQGDGPTINELRNSLLAEPRAKDLVVSDVSAQKTDTVTPGDRVRQIDAAEGLFAFAIHIPAGITAHVVYDWVKAWLKARGADTRVTEHPPKVSPTAERGAAADSDHDRST